MKRIVYWIVNKWFSFVFDYKCDEWQKEESLKHWYKARRAGYKKADMGFYYADLADSKNNDLGSFLF
jgi:hypothetical protein